jgi:hypothetical protein
MQRLSARRLCPLRVVLRLICAWPPAGQAAAMPCSFDGSRRPHGSNSGTHPPGVKKSRQQYGVQSVYGWWLSESIRASWGEQRQGARGGTKESFKQVWKARTAVANNLGTWMESKSAYQYTTSWRTARPEVTKKRSSYTQIQLLYRRFVSSKVHCLVSEA